MGALARALARLAAAACLAAPFLALAQDQGLAPDEPRPVPRLASRVTDQTGTLSAEQRAALEAKLAAFEQERGSQVAVLVVPSLGPETIEEFAGRVADTWQLGRKGVDDGVLFAIALAERRMRIHTGRGVQGTLTDALSKRIVSDLVAPHFRAGDFAGGIEVGVDAIMKAIEGEALPAPQRATARPRGAAPDFSGFMLLAVLLVPVLAMTMRAMFGRFFGAVASSGVVGFAGWLILGSLAIGIVAALFAFVFALAGGLGMARGVRRGGWGGVYVPGGGWGGGRGGGGFGGGFGGGGGGFDGGGASGSW